MINMKNSKNMNNTKNLNKYEEYKKYVRDEFSEVLKIDDEQNGGTISFLGPNRDQVNGIPLDDFISKITSEIKSKK